MELNANFWNERYAEQETGWDIGYPSPAIKEYLDGIKDKNIHILIPGCGKAYEAEYAHQLGFKNVFVADYAPLALEEFSKRVPDFPSEHLLVADFFKIEQSFDLIIEQTFFCALDPSLRDAYVQKMKSLLKPKGKLVGLMFNAPMNADRPPYGGTMEEYKERFKKAFGNIHIIPCKNSIKPREGNEVWIEISND